MYEINTFFGNFSGPNFCLRQFFVFFMFECVWTVEPETPRPSSSSQRVSSQGLGGWPGEERLLGTLGHCRGVGDTGQLVASGQYPLLRLDQQLSSGCLTLASLLIGFTYLLYCCQIHRSCLPEPLLVDHGSTFRAWFDRIWHQSGFLVLFDSSLYRNYTICI